MQQILEKYAGVSSKSNINACTILRAYVRRWSARVYAHLLKNIITDDERKLVVRWPRYFSSERMVQISIEQAVTDRLENGGSSGEMDGVLLSAAQR